MNYSSALVWGYLVGKALLPSVKRIFDISSFYAYPEPASSFSLVKRVKRLIPWCILAR
jgi:hypothetical protein